MPFNYWRFVEGQFVPTGCRVAALPEILRKLKINI
jgi:hypothetical protein